MHNLKRKKKFFVKSIEYFEGTSILVRHGSPNFEEAPLEVIKTTNWANQQKDITLNRLMFIPFYRSEKKHKLTYSDDRKEHEELVKQELLNIDGKFETYTLPKIVKTSRTIQLY